MNKVYVLGPGEDWIVDRFVKEWSEDNSDITVTEPRDADVIWLLADWCWNRLPIGLLRSKKVLTTVHHIVPEKFGNKERMDFKERDSITDAYHVYNESTRDFISRITSKPVHVIDYWANQKIWKKTGDKSTFRSKYGLPADSYIVGSFQRDTEGHDLRSPKLEKGPDLLADYLEVLHKFTDSAWNEAKADKKLGKLHVLLSGWRRQYVISRLNAVGIPYTYIELPNQETLNELYQTLDLYPVTARCEGGPQSLIECGLIGVPMVSRDVGFARRVLPEKSINDNVFSAVPEVPDVEVMKLPTGYSAYRSLLQKL